MVAKRIQFVLYRILARVMLDVKSNDMLSIDDYNNITDFIDQLVVILYQHKHFALLCVDPSANDFCKSCKMGDLTRLFSTPP